MINQQYQGTIDVDREKINPSKNIELKGILVPDSWDNNYEIQKMSLCTSGEKEYLIELNSTGKELLKFSGLKAVVRGQIVDSGMRRQAIVVSDYEIHSW